MRDDDLAIDKGSGFTVQKCVSPLVKCSAMQAGIRRRDLQIMILGVIFRGWFAERWECRARTNKDGYEARCMMTLYGTY